MIALDAFLDIGDGVGNHLVLDRGILVHAYPSHDGLKAVAPEPPHNIIFERYIEGRVAGVALASGAASKLVIDTPGLVAFRADDM
jgi:hypothetical protein